MRRKWSKKTPEMQHQASQAMWHRQDLKRSLKDQRSNWLGELPEAPADTAEKKAGAQDGRQRDDVKSAIAFFWQPWTLECRVQIPVRDFRAMEVKCHVSRNGFKMSSRAVERTFNCSRVQRSGRSTCACRRGRHGQTRSCRGLVDGCGFNMAAVDSNVIVTIV